jgi:myo-inositol-1(or 4)-monophosphatase
VVADVPAQQEFVRDVARTRGAPPAEEGMPVNAIDHDPATLARIAAEAALSVGDLLREGFRSGVSADTKTDFHDLVTVHDRAAEAKIRTRLDLLLPGSHIVGEEEGAIGDGPVTWYVDPIDGTNNFAGGVPFFCVSIGAELAGQLRAGVVYDPVRDELFAATPGNATLNGAPIAARRGRHDHEAVLGTDYPSHVPSAPDDDDADGTGDFERFAGLVRSFRTVRRLGSTALMLAYVAAGRLDVTFGVAKKPWDLAAGALLVEAAGGRYLPLRRDGERSLSAWTTPAYLAHGVGYDVQRSALSSVVDRYVTAH